MAAPWLLVLTAFLPCVQDPNDSPIRKMIREELPFFPVADRLALEFRWEQAWRDLEVGLTPEARNATLHDLRMQLGISFMRPAFDDCPSFERTDTPPSPPFLAGVELRAAYLSPQEYADYRARHDPLARRVVDLALEYYDLTMATALANRPSAESRATLLRQVHTLMDTMEEIVRPYLPSDPGRLAVVKAVLEDQRNFEHLFPYHPRAGAGSGLTSPITADEMGEIVRRMKAAVAAHPEEIYVERPTTGDKEKDLRIFYEQKGGPDWGNVIAQAVDFAIIPALIEIDDRRRNAAAIKSKLEELESAAREHDELDGKTLRIARDRFNAAHAGEPYRRDGAGDARAIGGERRGATLNPAPESADTDRRRKPGGSTREAWDARKSWILIGLLTLTGALLVGLWLRRRRTAA